VQFILNSGSLSTAADCKCSIFSCQ
jgi:hypothetical protein